MGGVNAKLHPLALSLTTIYFPLLLCRFGKHYELPLLVQSIIMIGTMMAMMHICVEVHADKGMVVRRLTGAQI